MAVACLLVAPDRVCAQIENAECFKCHGDPNKTVTHADGTTRAVYVDETAYGASIHGQELCISCHVDIESLEHPPDLAPVNCDTCHDIGESFAKSPHGMQLKLGNKDVSGCVDCHGMHDIRAAADPLSRTYPKNLPETCGRCHSDPRLARKHLISVLNPSDSYLKSEHARQIAKGNLKAASCTKCHGTHDLLPADNPDSRVYHKNISKTCGGCHEEALAEYQVSIHGQALAAGIKDAPTCTDCHGEHDIEGPGSQGSSVSPRKIVTATCTRCHDDERIMKRYGIVTGRQASYMDSYHGLASAAGSDIVASCASCHENHKILPPDDPASSVNANNLVQTCSKCHANAGPHFAQGKVHIMPTDPGQRALGIVRLAYLTLITVVIGGMVVHNTLSMARRAASKFRAELGGRNTYRRFTTGMTIGHLILTLTFIALALSGFALRYPETWWAQLLFHGEKGLAARGIVHRIAAVFLVGVAFWNGAFLLGTKAGRRELGYLWMRLRDAKDVFHNVFYMMGICRERPQFDRYTYMEKFEYWGMWWGSLLMIITGFCMWFVNMFLKFFPKIALDVVALIHFYEAWLAVLTIIVWHLYYMIFDPETYPMNWSWITGHITMDDFKERHPLEYERETSRKIEDEHEKH